MTGAWMKKSQLDCVKILTPSRCLTNFFLYCSIRAAIWAAISCGCTTAMPLEKEYLGMAYDWDRQWPDESMRISQNFWKQTNYISKRSSNETKQTNFSVICGIMLNFFLPPNQGDLGESWFGPLQLTLLWILQGHLGYHSWWLFPSPNFTETTTQVTTATAGLFFQRFCLAEREGVKTVKHHSFFDEVVGLVAGETSKLKGSWWV